MLSRTITNAGKRLLSKRVRFDVPHIRCFSLAQENAYKFWKESVPLSETIDWASTTQGNPLKEARKDAGKVEDLPEASQCPVTLHGDIGAEAMGLFTYE